MIAVAATTIAKASASATAATGTTTEQQPQQQHNESPHSNERKTLIKGITTNNMNSYKITNNT